MQTINIDRVEDVDVAIRFENSTSFDLPSGVSQIIGTTSRVL